MHELDIFHLYRISLAWVCGIYAAIQMIRGLIRWYTPVGVNQRRTAQLRRYFITHLLRTKVRAFGSDLAQVASLSAALYYIISLHGP